MYFYRNQENQIDTNNARHQAPKVWI